jgi:hypothetical protein
MLAVACVQDVWSPKVLVHLGLNMVWTLNWQINLKNLKFKVWDEINF